jgi:hypothetical protein
LVVLAYIEGEDDEDEDDQNEEGDNNNANKQNNGTNNNNNAKAQRPELRILTRSNEEISSDALTIVDYKQYKANDYRLGHMATGTCLAHCNDDDVDVVESLFYVVSPRDIVVARPRDLDDHLSWLMERKKYRFLSLSMHRRDER